MEKGLKSKIFLYSGLVFLAASFVLGLFFIFPQGNGNNPGPETPSGLPYISIYILIGGIAGTFSLLYISSRYMQSVYKDAVGKVFEIRRLRSKFRGDASFEGLTLNIWCNEELAVGDRVKATGIDSYQQGRARILILMGKKISPESSEYYASNQDTEMSPIG